jgi:hypothetical protein
VNSYEKSGTQTTEVRRMFLEKKDMAGYKAYTAKQNDPYVILFLIDLYLINILKVVVNLKMHLVVTEKQMIIYHYVDYFVNKINLIKYV